MNTTNNIDNVFHAYDVRGRVPEELNTHFFELLGKAYVHFMNAKKIAVGHDIRPESKEFLDAFIKGATQMGCNIVNYGEIATEMVYFGVGSDLSFDGGIVVTASHNPQGWNGCKMVGRKASPLSMDNGLFEIRDLMKENKFELSTTLGTVEEFNIYPSFKAKILSFLEGIEIKPLKIVVDAGNGIGGKIFDYVFGDFPFEIEKMYFEPDGTFPNHVPDPLKEENVIEIKKKTKESNADIGIAIDGDADRVFFIDKEGRNPSGVYTGSIFAKEYLKEFPNAIIVHDARITWPIQKEIEKMNGKSVINKAGHSYLKEAMQRENALFAAELSSHFFYKDFYNADSGFMTIVMMLKFIYAGLSFEKELDYLYEAYPNSGEINYTVDDIPSTLERIENTFKDGEITRVDGLSIEFDDWRVNVRSSNTQPLLRLNIEGKTKEIIVEKFKLLESIISGVRDNIPSLEELRSL